MKTVLIFFLVLLLGGCDTGKGFSRDAIVHEMPDPALLQKQLQGYSEIIKVEYREEKPHGPLRDGFSGYSFDYQGENIGGTIRFEEDGKKQITYHQYFSTLGSLPPPKLVQATLPFMKKVERDLETKFGLPEIETNLKVSFYGMKNPEEETPVVSSTATKSE